MVRFECRKFHQVNQLIGKEIQKGQIFKDYPDLTKMQGWTIGLISTRSARGLNTYQKDIEQEFKITRSTATGLLKQMEEEGYLYRETCDNDLRLKKIVLTNKALSLQQSFIKIISNVDQKILKGFSDSEKKTFHNLLDRVVLNLENEKGR